MFTAVKIAVRGRVQGVGFRPFVFQLAHKYGLHGTVQNNMDGVNIQLEGTEAAIQAFLTELKENPPRLSKVNEIIVKEVEPKNLEEFTIISSERRGTSRLVIPIDSAVCEDCLREMNDPTDLRYQYPFINCTQCGPRYTIIEELPYDRPFTTMKSFPMCEDCRKEYEDPTNRRHHAQPIACPTCGPKVQMLDKNGVELTGEKPLETAIQLLKEGQILAIKGIGGYHLACDAQNEQAVATLRTRKRRPLRPLAVMAASLLSAKQIAQVDEDETKLLTSPEAPIVVMQKHESYALADGVAPGMSTIGVMLPYTPLHHLLFTDPELSCLVMTSANPSGMPILYKEDEAFHYLAGIADFYLVHNREILHPVDDSVVQFNNGKVDFFRRSRGFVPDPFTAHEDMDGIVAFGGQQKTTFSIGRNKQIFIGPHIGDLDNIETIDHYNRELKHLLKWIDIPKRTAVIDAHPDYQVRNLVKEYGFSNIVEVQHHHAHMAACMVEHQLQNPAFGIILDGTGYGLDGNIWGFEIFYGDAFDFSRLAHLAYTPLPGGEKCIREPWRNAAAMLIEQHGEEGVALAKKIFGDRISEITILQKMIERNVNTVYAGTCGRLFDAVSALCGITLTSSYDGEAAIQLAEKMDPKQQYVSYPYTIRKDEIITLDFAAAIKAIALDVISGEKAAKVSGKFHETIVCAIIEVMEYLTKSNKDAEKSVVLSGGCFHNRYLRSRISAELKESGWNVYVPEQIPCNDGGLSYGQLAVAAANRRGNHVCGSTSKGSQKDGIQCNC